jgi:hypothetical protein
MISISSTSGNGWPKPWDGRLITASLRPSRTFVSGADFDSGKNNWYSRFPALG